MRCSRPDTAGYLDTIAFDVHTGMVFFPMVRIIVFLSMTLARATMKDTNISNRSVCTTPLARTYNCKPHGNEKSIHS